MAEIHFALFETAIGTCGLAWGPNGLVGARLPDSAGEAPRHGFTRRIPDAVPAEPPPEVAQVIRRIQDLLAGGKDDDLRDVVLDLDRVSEFQRRVYAIARAIPPGETRTYGEIARRLGDDPRLARDVGEAMGKNPWPIVVPCHRVVAAGGKLGGFSAPGGSRTKLRMLQIEGAAAAGPPDLFGGM